MEICFWQKRTKKKKSILFALSNEGREIAAFEEETLALRRELQEARASRTLAENHAAKCVNFAVSSSVTPVTFDTPCITSTPVRTALSDTRSLSPVLSSAISSHSSSASSVLRSVPSLRSHSAEMEILPPVSETADQRPSTEADFESTLREEPARSTEDESDRPSEITLASCSTYNNATNMIRIKSRNESGNQNSEFIDIGDTFSELFTYLEMCKIHARENKLKSLRTELKSLKEEIIQVKIGTGTPEKQLDDKLLRKWKRMEEYVKSLQKKDETEIDALSSVLKEQEDSNSDVMSKIERSIDHASWQTPGEFRNQRSSFKKPRRKKSSLKRSFSETDKNSRDSKSMADSSSSNAINHDTTVNEEGNSYLNDDHASRAIIEVPDVAVVGGGCIMPKDFCSMKPLTSRTQTAPSRATAFTYTTAFI